MFSVNESIGNYNFDDQIVDGENKPALSSQFLLLLLPVLPDENILQQDGALAQCKSYVTQL